MTRERWLCHAIAVLATAGCGSANLYTVPAALPAGRMEGTFALDGTLAVQRVPVAAQEPFPHREKRAAFLAIPASGRVGLGAGIDVGVRAFHGGFGNGGADLKVQLYASDWTLAVLPGADAWLNNGAQSAWRLPALLGRRVGGASFLVFSAGPGYGTKERRYSLQDNDTFPTPLGAFVTGSAGLRVATGSTALHPEVSVVRSAGERAYTAVTVGVALVVGQGWL